MLCEGSTILVYPDGMKLLQYLHMPILLIPSKFQLHLSCHVSATSRFVFWTRLASCKATLLNLGPFLLKLHMIAVLPTLNLPDISFGPYHFYVHHSGVAKFATANFQ